MPERMQATLFGLRGLGVVPGRQARESVSATGGMVTAVTTLDPQQIGQVLPFFLPDGRRVLFNGYGGPDAAGIYLSALDGRAQTRLAPDASQPVALPADSGHAAGGCDVLNRQPRLDNHVIDTGPDHQFSIS